MPGQLPIHAETLRSEVMHDLGEHGRGGHAAPTRADALAYATYRGQQRGIDVATIREAARQAYRDWRATQRARELDVNRPIREAFMQGRDRLGTLGVRVILTIQINRPDGVIMFKRVSVLVNVAPGMSVGQIQANAAYDWNARMFQGPRYSEYQGEIVQTEIAQVVESPFGQAQVTYE
jgi:hypothetical protein